MSDPIEKLQLIANGDTDYTLYPDEAESLLAEVRSLRRRLTAHHEMWSRSGENTCLVCKEAEEENRGQLP